MYKKIHESLENNVTDIENFVSQSLMAGTYSKIIELYNKILDMSNGIYIVKNSPLYGKASHGITRKMNKHVTFHVNSASKLHSQLSQSYNKLCKNKITSKDTIIIDLDKCLNLLEKLETYIKPYFDKGIQVQKEAKIKETVQSWKNNLPESLDILFEQLKNKQKQIPSLIDHIYLAIKFFPQKLAKTKTEWARTLFDLCYNYALSQSKIHPAKAVEYFNKALQILHTLNLLEFSKTKIEEETFDILFYLALANSISHNRNCFTKTIKYFEKSTHLKNLNDPYVLSMYFVASTYIDRRSIQFNSPLIMQSLEKIFSLFCQQKSEITNNTIVDSFEILLFASIKYDPQQEIPKILDIADKLILLILNRQIKPLLLIEKIIEKGHKMFAATPGFIPLGKIFTEVLMKRAKFDNFYACEILFKQPFRGYRNSFVNHPLLGNRPIAFNNKNNRFYFIHDGKLIKINPSHRSTSWMYGLENSVNGSKYEPINLFYLVIKHFNLQELRSIKHILIKTSSHNQITKMFSQKPNPYNKILTKEKMRFLQTECKIIACLPKLNTKQLFTNSIPKSSPTSTTNDVVLKQTRKRKRTDAPTSIQNTPGSPKRQKRKIEKATTNYSKPITRLPPISSLFNIGRTPNQLSRPVYNNTTTTVFLQQNYPVVLIPMVMFQPSPQILNSSIRNSVQNFGQNTQNNYQL